MAKRKKKAPARRPRPPAPRRRAATAPQAPARQSARHAQLANLLGQPVEVCAISGRAYQGRLAWHDDHALGLTPWGSNGTVVLMMGALEQIAPAEQGLVRPPLDDMG